MTDRHHDRLQALRSAVLLNKAVTPAEMRVAAANGGELPDDLATYAATVRDSSHRITDGDIERLVGAGYSEEEVFELTVAAALGAALRRLDAGLAATRGER